jgi:hypothetical protein
MAKPTAAESSNPPASEARWWKKDISYRRQHWVIRALKKLDAEVQLWRMQHPGGRMPHTWLLPRRTWLRAIYQADAAPALRYYLLSCSRELKPLVVWLLGRSTQPSHLYGLPAFAQDELPIVRRHAARALRRLEGWSSLAEAARRFPDDQRLQWYAHASIIKRPYEERLRNFAKFVDSSQAAAAEGPSRMPLWFADLDWLRRPPKSVEYIRRMLRRIQRLVHGRRV